MMQSFVIIHPFQLPAGWNFSRPHIKCSTWKQYLNSKAEYSNTQQGLPVQNKRRYLQSCKALASGFVCQKAAK
jgi:hypothetical protein